MPTQKAIVIQGPKDAKVVTDRPIPALREGFILVKTVAVALNPTDWKHIDFMPSKGALVGCDYSGIVEEVGKNVQTPFKKGDKVCGFVHGSDALQHENGAFAEYIVAKGDVQIKIPDNLSFEEAATLGVGVSTCGQALYQSLKLALPTEPLKETKPVLIYGGSTATGSLAIQYAKLSGYTVVTTCSPRNFELVRSLGADAAFDYNDPKCAEQIREVTNNNLKLAFDTISEGSSPAICANALSSSSGSVYTALLPVKDFPRTDVQNNGSTMAYSMLGDPLSFAGHEIPAMPEHFEFGKMFWPLTEKLLAEGKLKVHPPKVGKGGLEGVLEGLDELRQGKVSGVKLVYRIS